MRRVLPFSLALATLTVACADRDPTAAIPEFSITQAEPRVGGVTVMTQNLYVGADVDRVIRALGTPDPGDDFPALLFAIETLSKTAFPARAEAIADEIARARPHAVGLQEVSQINIDLRPLNVPVVVSQDFLVTLQDALERRGVHYQVAASVTNINVSLVFGLVNLVDHDALLIDADRVSVNAAHGQNFSVNLNEVAPGIVLVRGWVWARTTIGGQPYTFVSAHTEANLAGAPPGLVAQIRAAQVGELVASLGPSERVVMMGDLNDTPGSPMYDVLMSTGFTDSWAALRPGVQGLTCCHVADLSDQVADFDQRIDYVFTRGITGPGGRLFGQIDRFGNVPADRLAGPAHPIWPSDHAGVTATLRP